MVGNFDRKLRLPRIYFRVLLHAANMRHGKNGFTSFPKKGVLRIFFSPWKIRRLRQGLNPRTWVPEASTLPLDHRRRSPHTIRATYMLTPSEQTTDFVSIHYFDSTCSDVITGRGGWPFTHHIKTRAAFICGACWRLLSSEVIILWRWAKGQSEWSVWIDTCSTWTWKERRVCQTWRVCVCVRECVRED